MAGSASADPACGGFTAGESVNELSLGIDRGLGIGGLASTIHIYPTFGFAVQLPAAEAAFTAAASGVRGRALRAVRRFTWRGNSPGGGVLRWEGRRSAGSLAL